MKYKDANYVVYLVVSKTKFMKDIIDFLKELKANNNRDWFEANKARYKAAQEAFNKFTEQLIEGISIFDPSIEGVTVKDCTYRIYRDVRFSPNKEPYKVNMGAYVCPRGKKSGYAGYYFHLEPNSSILAAGLHCPEPNVIRSVRDEIVDNGASFVASINKAKGFKIDWSTQLKRLPKGFENDTEFGDYIKLRDFDLLKPINADSPNLLEQVLKEFKTTKEFNDILNRAVKFAHEELS